MNQCKNPNKKANQETSEVCNVRQMLQCRPVRDLQHALLKQVMLAQIRTNASSAKRLSMSKVGTAGQSFSLQVWRLLFPAEF